MVHSFTNIMRKFRRLFNLAVICTAVSFALAALKLTITPALDWVLVLAPILAPLVIFAVVSSLIVLIVLIRLYEK